MVLAVGAAVVACDVDFTEPAPAPTPPLPGSETSRARLVAHIDLVTHEALRFRFDAGLVPGMEPDGAFREVPDDTLWLGGMPLTPEAVGPTGQRGYRWLPAAGMLPDPLRLEPPPVPGTVGPPPVPFRTYTRQGADTLILTVGDTLRLDIATLGSESDLLQNTLWTLRLSGPDGTLTSRGEDAPLPPTLHVPAAWLEWSFGTDMRATLSVQEVSTFDPSDSDYELHLTVTSVVEWVVRWEDQPTS